ncbi:hypothetical protein M885DRAFT_485014 [Pelagophyceae sp. CCMP2097]|nr:hypothetical protein M885DRAFT_485014 [Pelagophyceae sp. CCMP2097]
MCVAAVDIEDGPLKFEAVAAAKVDTTIISLTQARPTRNTFENPFTWWEGTPWFIWNFEYGGWMGIWSGPGEAEALGELFFDNLATLLSVTDLMLGFFLNVLIKFAAVKFSPEYAEAIVNRYTTLYYQRCIPGTAFAILFGNFYYAYMAGRLAKKENRLDVTAQPYGLNTTGAFITLGAVNLTALFSELYKQKNLDKGFAGDWNGAGIDVADNAFKIAVSVNFLTGVMECAGCLIGEPIRKFVPAPAYYSLMTGVGFVYLALAPMIKIASEPILCLVPFLIVLVGFFGGVKYTLGKTGFTMPIALVAILTACLIGWLGGCSHKHGAKWATCTGTSKHDASFAFREHAGKLDAWGGGIFVDVAYVTWEHMKFYFGIIIVVGVVGFGATLACVESASAAGDDYPMAETMIADGLGTMIGACMGSFYGCTVYIGHPIHKSLGAKRGYSVINGCLWAILLTSGLFGVLYRVIPSCSNNALLIFVGLIMCRQAIEDNPPRYYPAIFFGLFSCICNWAKLYIDPGVAWRNEIDAGWWDTLDAGNWGSTGMGIKMMGQGGGEWFTLIMTSVFCYCIDRAFLKGFILCAGTAVLQGLTSLPTMYNQDTASSKMGPEKAGLYPKMNDDMNFSWAWATGFAMCAGFFLFHYGLQRMGMIAPPIVEDYTTRTKAPAMGAPEH